jgi:hypothetical protein
LLASTNCAAIVSTLPATTLDALGVTWYLTGVPPVGVTVVTVLDLPTNVPVLAVIRCVTPGVALVVNTTTVTPLALVVVALAEKTPPFVLAHVTAWFASGSGLPAPSASCARTVTAPPAVTLVAVALTRYWATVPVVVAIVGLVPVIPPVVAVTTCVVPAEVPTVNETVATPDVFVGVDALEKLPPFVLDQVTVWPATATEFPLASANCALSVIVAPAVGFVVLGATRYRVGVAGVVTIGVVLPLIEPLVAATTCDVPATVLVVNVIVATPVASVVLVALLNEPPFVLVQVTTWPAVASGALFASTKRALTVTELPTTTDDALDVTTYRVAAGGPEIVNDALVSVGRDWVVTALSV